MPGWHFYFPGSLRLRNPHFYKELCFPPQLKEKFAKEVKEQMSDFVASKETKSEEQSPLIHDLY